MYKLKKIFALFLAIVLATSFSTVAFAAENYSGIPENATKHTIEVTVEPGETIDETDEEIAPYIWGTGNYSPPVNGVTYTPTMNIPERYFAFETVATTTNGGTTSGSYSVFLVRSVSANIASLEGSVDGQTYKRDWITIESTTATDYQFKIVNQTTTSISVTLTYYSWS